MAWGRRPLPHDIDEILDTLPTGYVVRTIGGARVVIGPGGAHVVIVVVDPGEEHTRMAARLAATARSTLAEHVAWVPFVHTLVVSDAAITSTHATIVPPSLLTHLLTESVGSVDEAVLGPLRGVVDDGALDGLSALAPPPARRSSARNPFQRSASGDGVS